MLSNPLPSTTSVSSQVKTFKWVETYDCFRQQHKSKIPGLLQDLQPYAPGSIADLCGILFGETFTVSQHLATSHVNGTDSQTQSLGSLHPSFCGFQEETGRSMRLSPAHEDFLEVYTHNLFDTICFSFHVLIAQVPHIFHPSQLIQQDHLDGRISLLLHCPGFTVQPNLGPKDIVTDVYITPHAFDAA